jgi:hypothetical protein
MSIYASKPEQKERELIPAGMHQAYLYRIVYLGTIKGEYEGKETQAQKIWIDFEFPQYVVDFEDKDTQEKKQFVKTIGKELTLSLHEKGKLLPMIEGWLGRKLTADELVSFDVCSLLGKPALINVTHSTPNAKGKVYENIAGINPIMQGMQLVPSFNDIVEIGKGEWDAAMGALPEFLQDKIKSSNEWMMREGDHGQIHDDIPVIGDPDEVRIEDMGL